MDKNLIPLVSVILPVYNAEKYVVESINSILNQSFTDFEFIIINDGSSDKSEDAILSVSDPRIQYYTNDTNLGLIGTLNRGISLSRGKYVARMDNDDICLPERLKKQVAFLETHSDVGVLGTGFYFVNADGGIYSETSYPTSSQLLKWSLCFFSPLAHPTVMMRKELVQKEDGYNTEMTHCEDYDLWGRLSSKTKLSNLTEVLFKLRKHDMNSSTLFQSKQFSNSLIVSRKMISDLLQEDISMDIIRNLWMHSSVNIDEAVSVADLINRIYLKVISEDDLSYDEKKYLQRDFSIRTYNVLGSWTNHVYAWKYICLSFYRDPLFIPSRIKSFVKSYINNEQVQN